MNSKEWQKLIDGRIDWLNEAIRGYVQKHLSHPISDFSEDTKISVVSIKDLKRIDRNFDEKLREANYVTYYSRDNFYIVRELLDQQAEQMSDMKEKYNQIFGTIKDTNLYEIIHYLSDLAIFKSTKEVDLGDELSVHYKKFQPLEGLIYPFKIKSKGFILNIEGGKGFEHINNTSPRFLDEFIRLSISNRILVSSLVKDGFFPTKETALSTTLTAYSPSEVKEDVENASSFLKKLWKYYEVFVEDYLVGRIPQKIHDIIERNGDKMSEGIRFGLMMSQMRGKLEYFPGILDALYSK